MKRQGLDTPGPWSRGRSLKSMVSGGIDHCTVNPMLSASRLRTTPHRHAPSLQATQPPGFRFYSDRESQVSSSTGPGSLWMEGKRWLAGGGVVPPWIVEVKLADFSQALLRRDATANRPTKVRTHGRRTARRKRTCGARAGFPYHNATAGGRPRTRWLAERVHGTLPLNVHSFQPPAKPSPKEGEQR